MTESLKKKLASYTALASSILAAQSANGQIVYHDVIPNDSLNNYNLMEYQFLDLNNDGIFDMGFRAEQDAAGYNNVFATFNINNALCDLTPLSQSALINSSIYFVSSGTMLYHFSNSSSSSVWGQWSGIEDKYFALKIMQGGNDYYGWIRLDVDVPSSKITIKDYALNLTPDVGILAGDKGCTSANPEIPVITQTATDTLVSTPASTYQWYMNGNELTGETNQSLSFNLNGDYSLITTDTNNCHLQSSVFHYGDCNPLPITISLLTSDTTCVGSYAHFLFTPYTPNNTFDWYINGTLGIWGTNDYSYNVLLDSSIDVNIILTNWLYGCQDTSNTIHVEVLQQNLFGPISGTPTYIGCNADTAIITYPLIFNNATYNWSLENNFITSSASNIYNATIPGFYDVNISGCPNSSNEFGISPATNPPTPTIWVNSDTLHTGLYFKYQWFLNGNILATDTLQNLITGLQGNFSVGVWNEAGCFTLSQQVTVDTCAFAQINIYSGSPPNFCGDSALVELSTSSIPSNYQVQWFINNNPISVPTTDTVFTTKIFSSSNIVAYLFNSNSACADTSSAINFLLSQNPEINIFTSTPSILCGDSALIELTTTSIPLGYEVQWYLNNNPVSVPTTDSVFATEIFSSSDIVAYLFNPNIPCNDTSSALNFLLNPAPDIPLIYESNGALFTDIYPSYQWYYNGNIMLGETSQFVFPLLDGNYSVVVSNQYDCSNTSANFNFIYISAAFISNENDIQLLMCEKFAEIKFLNKKWIGSKIKLINNLGQLINNFDASESLLQIDISHLSKGIYFISIQNNHEILNYKISIL